MYCTEFIDSYNDSFRFFLRLSVDPLDNAVFADSFSVLKKNNDILLNYTNCPVFINDGNSHLTIAPPGCGFTTSGSWISYGLLEPLQCMKGMGWIVMVWSTWLGGIDSSLLPNLTWTFFGSTKKVKRVKNVSVIFFCIWQWLNGSDILRWGALDIYQCSSLLQLRIRVSRK